MKMLVGVLLLNLLMTTESAMAKTKYCYHDDDRLLFNVISAMTLPPLTTTTIIACAIADDAEINRLMLLKEATMLVEENKIFVPSFLGSYADRNDLEIRAAARDVLVNGVR